MHSWMSAHLAIFAGGIASLALPLSGAAESRPSVLPASRFSLEGAESNLGQHAVGPNILPIVGEYQLDDLQNDPHEWTDLSDDSKYVVVKRRLQTAMKRWQTDTDDPLADPEKLRLLMDENDAVFKTSLRSPRDGWQYLKYLASDERRVIFQQRELPAEVPREGHAQDAKTYGTSQR